MKESKSVTHIIHLSDIIWDAPNDTGLPTEIDIEVNKENEYLLDENDTIAEYLSDTYSYCVGGYSIAVEAVKKTMKCYTMNAKKFETKLNEIGITYNQFQELHKMWDNILDDAERAEINNMLCTFDDENESDKGPTEKLKLHLEQAKMNTTECPICGCRVHKTKNGMKCSNIICPGYNISWTKYVETHTLEEYEQDKIEMFNKQNPILDHMASHTEEIFLDHADIVTSHKCNNNCSHCIDKFVHTTDEEVLIADILKFLYLLRTHTSLPLEVLLLGGEPTMLHINKLENIARAIKIYGFVPIMSTNGRDKEKILQLLNLYRWIQVTVNNDADIDFWKPYADKINVKLAGDGRLTMEKLNHFIEYTKDFERRSVSMYFTEDFEELCKDKEVWALLDTLEWQRNGSYMYAFYKSVRFKRCIPGETNIIDEPSVPKLYPNGNYNKTWRNEELDAYLGEMK